MTDYNERPNNHIPQHPLLQKSRGLRDPRTEKSESKSDRVPVHPSHRKTIESAFEKTRDEGRRARPEKRRTLREEIQQKEIFGSGVDKDTGQKSHPHRAAHRGKRQQSHHRASTRKGAGAALNHRGENRKLCTFKAR